jgi:hypothetical protein
MMDVDMGNGLRFNFESVEDVTAAARHEETRIAFVHKERRNTYAVETTTVKTGEPAMGTTLMLLGATKFASIVESLEDTWRAVESCQGDG